MNKSSKMATVFMAVAVLFAMQLTYSCTNGEKKEGEKTEKVTDNDLSWLQGYWSCKAPFGTSDIRIFNDSIADLSLGSTQAGKFKIIDGNKLVTDYGIENYEVSYELDLEHKRIVFGDKKDGKFYMKK